VKTFRAFDCQFLGHVVETNQDQEVQQISMAMAIKRIHITISKLKPRSCSDHILSSSFGFQEVKVARQLLFSVLDRVELVDSRPEVGGISSEGDLEQVEETVDASEEGLRAVSHEEEMCQMKPGFLRSSPSTHVCAVAFFAGTPSNTMTRSAK